MAIFQFFGHAITYLSCPQSGDQPLDAYRQVTYLSETLLIFPNVNKAGFQNNSGAFKD